MMSSNILSVFSAIMYVAAYGATAAYTLTAQQHRDMCPFYIAVTLAAALHVSIMTIHTWRR